LSSAAFVVQLGACTGQELRCPVHHQANEPRALVWDQLVLCLCTWPSQSAGQVATGLATESHTACLPWLQVEQLYYWLNGVGYAGVGLPLNSTPGPYGHWSWTHYDARSTNLAYRYHAALSTEDYSYFTGNLNSSANLQASANYRQVVTAENAFGWKVVSDTAVYIPLCEIPISVYGCPLNPPAARRPEPGTVCKCPPPPSPLPAHGASCVYSATTGHPAKLAVPGTWCGSAAVASHAWWLSTRQHGGSAPANMVAQHPPTWWLSTRQQCSFCQSAHQHQRLSVKQHKSPLQHNSPL
jgi:hypothetical protein